METWLCKFILSQADHYHTSTVTTFYLIKNDMSRMAPWSKVAWKCNVTSDLRKLLCQKFLDLTRFLNFLVQKTNFLRFLCRSVCQINQLRSMLSQMLWREATTQTIHFSWQKSWPRWCGKSYSFSHVLVNINFTKSMMFVVLKDSKWASLILFENWRIKVRDYNRSRTICFKVHQIAFVRNTKNR